MYDSPYKYSGSRYIAGVDEVGRGCFAGPIVAAAVILPDYFPFVHLVQDSKTLSEKVREKLSTIIKMYALTYSISEVPVEIINTRGIGFANQTALSQCVIALAKKPDFIVVDGFLIKNLKPVVQKAIIHGDSLHPSIAAASIIAKVYRDKIMQKLHVSHPQYYFHKNKGYGTNEHRKALQKYGLSPMHRTSFDIEKFTY